MLRADAILLDDSPFVREDWENQLGQAGRILKAYGEPEQLIEDLERTPFEGPIFLDHDIGHALSGLDVALLLHKKGKRKLFLATGYSPVDFKEVAHLVTVVGKDPPAWLLEPLQSIKLTADERTALLAAMTPAERAVFNRRHEEFSLAYYGGSLGLFPVSDGSGLFWPDAVLDAWERAIYESKSDEEMKAITDAAWRGAK